MIIEVIASTMSIPNTIIVMMRRALNDGRFDLNGIAFFELLSFYSCLK